MITMQQRLQQLRENPEQIKMYAGRIKGKQFYPCKKCLGRGAKEYTLPAGHDENGNKIVLGRLNFCDCVLKNVKQEVEDSNGANN